MQPKISQVEQVVAAIKRIIQPLSKTKDQLQNDCFSSAVRRKFRKIQIYQGLGIYFILADKVDVADKSGLCTIKKCITFLLYN
ncbi:hypothetical protein SOV_52470 [Sporomusa ovata DSM 2662]|uniref:Uncharacterized protein n=1 Tax=Sporomusa ovata TaxID=2378 RepID=A0A0U1KRE2_9FIRM|nr:hypothetical protein SOV_2c05160 [Sporomusa ovata DSM 2662]CQR69971.1 hypothetical protein SpAn4DRAFT_4836 [Sporomusa ovata]